MKGMSAALANRIVPPTDSAKCEGSEAERFASTLSAILPDFLYHHLYHQS
jgi:hypothetical protein